MKKFVLSLVGVIFLGLLVWTTQRDTTRVISTEIYIAASMDQVWKVLSDFDKWAEWNPTVSLAEGKASLGSKLNLTIRGKEGRDASNYQPVVVESRAPNGLRWRANMMADFVFRNERVFTLTERDGGTLFAQREVFSGLMVAPMWKSLEGFVGPSLEKMNQALKAKLESGALTK